MLLLLLVAHLAVAPSTTSAQLVDLVTRMARIGRAASPSVSPDGTQLAFVSDRTGIPQVWVIAVDGSDEGHGFRKEKNRITSTVKMVEFFVAHLIDGRAASLSSSRHVQGDTMTIFHADVLQPFCPCFNH